MKSATKNKTGEKKQSTQIQSKAPILANPKETVPEPKQSESHSMLLNLSAPKNESVHSAFGHQVIMRGRTVVFDDRSTLCSIPLNMQRDVYRQTVVLNHTFSIATHKRI